MSGTYRTRRQRSGRDGDAVEPVALATRAGELARYTLYILHKQWFGMGETGPGGYHAPGTRLRLRALNWTLTGEGEAASRQLPPRV